MTDAEAGRDVEDLTYLEQVDGARASYWVLTENTCVELEFMSSAEFAEDYEAARECAKLRRSANAMRRVVRNTYTWQKADNSSLSSGGILLAWNWQEDENYASNGRVMLPVFDFKKFQKSAPGLEVRMKAGSYKESEPTNWIWKGVHVCPPACVSAIFLFGVKSEDKTILQEFSLENGKPKVGGFFEILPGEISVDWLDADTLLLASGPMTKSYGATTIRCWKRGTPLEKAEIFFGPIDADHIAARVICDRTFNKPSIICFNVINKEEQRVYFCSGRPQSKPRQLNLPLRCKVEFCRNNVAVYLMEQWAWSDRDEFAAGSLLVFNLADDGTLTNPQVLWQCNETFVRQHTIVFRKMFFTTSRLFFLYFQNHSSGLFAWNRQSDWRPDPLMCGIVAHHVDLVPLDFTHHLTPSDRLVILEHSPIMPPSIRLWDLDQPDSPWLLFDQVTPSFRTDGLEFRVANSAIANDGAAIIYSEVTPVDPSVQSEAIILHGYGGYGHDPRPCYDPISGKLFTERNIGEAWAGIRGDGNHGESWTVAGRGLGRLQACRDFAAVASDLVRRRKVSHFSRIIGIGASNGGLLVANSLIHSLGHFGALICIAPLIDVAHFVRRGGTRHCREYTIDPAVHRAISPLDNIPYRDKTNVGIPSLPGLDPALQDLHPHILIITCRYDPVTPAFHGRKLAAKLQANGWKNVWYYEFDWACHGAGTAEQRAKLRSLCASFIRYYLSTLNRS